MYDISLFLSNHNIPCHSFPLKGTIQLFNSLLTVQKKIASTTKVEIKHYHFCFMDVVLNWRITDFKRLPNLKLNCPAIARSPATINKNKGTLTNCATKKNQ